MSKLDDRIIAGQAAGLDRLRAACGASTTDRAAGDPEPAPGPANTLPSPPRCMSLRAFAKLWQCEAEWEPTGDGPHSIFVFDPLDIDAPEDARPYCHGLSEVTFYDATGRHRLGDCRSHGLNSPFPDLLHLDGRWWEVASGKVVYRGGRWCMRWRCYDHTRAAMMMTAGMEAYQS